MKVCPFCAEQIQQEAIKCRYCGEFLDGRSKENTEKKVSWYQRPASIFLGFLFVGPFVLPLVWFHPTYSRSKKVVITGIIIVITFYLSKVVMNMLDNIGGYYKEVGIF